VAKNSWPQRENSLASGLAKAMAKTMARNVDNGQVPALVTTPLSEEGRQENGKKSKQTKKILL
jgi:hypothetical protein